MPAVLEIADNLAYMADLQDQSVDLVVTSPPYNIGKEYETRSPMSEYVANQAAVIAEAVRLLTPTGSIAWQVGTHVTNDSEIVPLDVILYPLFKAHGLFLRNRIIWHYEHGLHAKRRLSGRHETILWFSRSNTDYVFNLDPIRVPSKYPLKRHFKGPRKGELSGNPLGKNPSDVWIIPNVKANHPEKTAHPAQFPVELVERLVLALTNPGGTVLDPYAGSGSSLIAAVKHGRRAYGCDISPEYVQIAHERLAALAAGTLKLRPMGRPIHVPR